jgi:DNA repair protein RadA/Sms
MTKASARAARTAYRCTECGADSVRWVGRCPECQTWGSVSELGVSASRRAVTPSAVAQPARPIGELSPDEARAQPTGVGELDRVLGGGLVPGSIALLAGEPGVGKSTLLLDVAHRFAANGGTALIVTGEESTAQVRLRAERIGAVDDRLFLAAENDLGALLTHVDEVRPGLLVVDSVQTISTDSVDGGAGGVPQIRAVAAALIAVAKQRGIATVLVGHVTKDGSIAGPRVLEHLVDVVLHFEGDRHSSLRLVRAAKNRYGPADEIGCFEMRENGMAGLSDPSQLFLSDRTTAVAGTCVTITVEGRRSLVTEVQALVTRAAGGGNPRRAVSDLDSSRVAMLLAVLARHNQLWLHEQEVYVATVGGIAAHEPAADLGIALAIASAAREVPIPPSVCAIGEVSLSGDVRRVPWIGRRLAEAGRLGFRTVLVPAAHAGEALPPGPIEGVRTIPVTTIADALASIESLSRRGAAPRRPVLRTIRGGGASSPTAG